MSQKSSLKEKRLKNVELAEREKNIKIEMNVNLNIIAIEKSKI